jgi:hypothetical protein
MPPVLEAPAPTTPAAQSESDALKSAFNTAMAEQAGVDPKASRDDTPAPDATPTLTPAKKEEPPAPNQDKATESIVPEEFTGKPKTEEKKDNGDEILTTEERGALTSKLGGKAQESFQKLEAAAKAKIQAIQAQLTEARAKAEAAPSGPSKEQEEALKAAHERAMQLEEKLERAAYAESPKFRKFGADIDAELASAKSYLGADTPQALIDVAAGLSGQARLKALRDAGLDAETIAALGPHLANADRIRRERDASLESWKTDHAREVETARTRQAQEEAARERQERAVLDEVKADITGKIPGFTKVDGHDKWNAKVDENFKMLEEFAMGRGPLKELIKLGAEGVAARTTAFINEELKKKVDALTEENSRLKAAQPGTGSTNTAVTTAKPVTEADEHRAAFNKAKSELGSGPFGT